MEEYETIRRIYGGFDEPPRFIVHRRGLILALCIRFDLHQRIHADPAEVWIDSRDHMKEWGERLAMDTGAVAVYVSPGPGVEFRRQGIYHVIGSTDEPLELARRMAYPSVPRLSRIVFLSGPHQFD